jgi:RNA polymerase sigma-70 factor (ECF subfamily)
MVGDHHRSEELFQEVFLAVWTKRDQYEFPRPFRSWLYAIAVNRCRADHRARALPVQPLGEGDPLSLEGSPADGLVASETAESITQAVLRLPPQQRAVVTLRIWDELSYARIAAIVGCTEATVRSHMHLALGALRKDLQRTASAGEFRAAPGN